MTMSQEEFVARLHQLGDVEPPSSPGSSTAHGVLPHDARRAAVGRRITARRQQLTVAAALAIVLVLVGTTLARQFTAAAPPAISSLSVPPAQFQAADGTVYRRIGEAAIDTTKKSDVSITVPAGVEPIAVYATCALADPHSREDSAMSLRTSTSYQGLDGVFSCRGSQPEMQEFSRSELTGTTLWLSQTGTTLWLSQTGTLADAPADAPAAWTFTIYTWVVPKSLRPAPAAPTMPATISLAGRSYTLVQHVDGVWPQQRSAELTVPHGTKLWVLAIACTSAIAGRYIYVAPAVPVDTNVVTCADLNHGLNLNATGNIDMAQGKSNTMTFPFTFDPIYLMRGGSWTAGIYTNG